MSVALKVIAAVVAYLLALRMLIEILARQTAQSEFREVPR